jgi:uncharacterized protein (UPF0548 family)
VRLPSCYHHLRRGAVIGSGAKVFADGVHALAGWQAHLRAGLRVAASAATAEPGTVVVLGLGAGAIRIAASCRVIYIVDEPHRRGFAYGTLPGHPERGEEALIIEHSGDGAVSFTITAFSAPATCWPRPPARPGEPSSAASPTATCTPSPTDHLGRARLRPRPHATSVTLKRSLVPMSGRGRRNSWRCG